MSETLDTSAPAPSPLQTPVAWDLVAAGYDRRTRPYLQGFSRVGLDLLELEPEHSLLDVACGPGTTSLLAAPYVRDIQALDFSTEMLAQARANLSAASAGNISLHHGDGQDLPFGAGSFDRAVSMFGLIFFPDRRRGLRELVRVLVPGGRALVSSWAPLALSPLMSALVEALRVLDPSRPSPSPDLTSLENPEVFEREMREAGFSSVRVIPVSQDLEFESADELLASMGEGTAPIVLLRRALGEQVWADKLPEVLATLRAVVADRRALASTAYLALGTK